MKLRGRLRLGTTFAALTVITLLGAGLAVQPASAAVETDPPVTADDTYTVYAGSFLELDVLANDSDPQGTELAICRVTPPKSKRIQIETVEDTALVGLVHAKAHGTYTFTYYACNYTFLAPATVTIKVERLKPVRVRKLADRPGKLKVTNPNDKRVDVVYGSRREPVADGRVRVGPRSSSVISVHRTKIVWVAFLPKVFAIVNHGTVRNIELKGDGHSRGLALSPRMQRLWQSQR